MEGEQVHVLSIQSHVVSGYVGNTAAVFPLQLLGFDVHVINSVQFSNHTGYPVVKGTVMNGAELDALIDGLVSNDLCRFDYLLTGYIGSETFLNSVLRVLEACRRINPNIKYICDPVLGDNNKLYVPLPLIDIFRVDVLPQAFMITPNQLEAEYLSGMRLRSEAQVQECMLRLRSLGPRVVALTSCELEERPGQLCCYVLSAAQEQGQGEPTSVLPPAEGERLLMTRIVVDKQSDFHYTGTGDVTCALLLAWVHRLLLAPDGSEGEGAEEAGGREHACGRALGRSIATIQAVLLRAQRRAMSRSDGAAAAAAAASSPAGEGEEQSAVSDALRAIKCRVVELPIVQSKRDIESPPPLAPHQYSSWTVHAL
jgi:pyridoxine kinase